MADYNISQQDRLILRELAKKQQEYANLPKMKELSKLWYRHNDLIGERPMVTIEMWTFGGEIVKEFKCTSETGRNIEDAFYNTFANYEYIGDDVVIPPVFPVGIGTWFKPFGLEVECEHAEGSLGHKFKHRITDLKDDFHKLGKSEYGTEGRERAEKWKSFLENIFGDILPVQLIGSGVYSVPTQDVVHILSMENMLFSMYDYPDAFHKMMEMLSDDYIEYFRWMEDQKLLLPTTSYGRVAQGSFCFTNELQSDAAGRDGLGIKLVDIWGFMDSQESAGISPEMYNEFVFPYYKRISDLYGLFSYGCCEAVDPIWDMCISKCDNLRKVSISPWCNEEFMGERLRDSKVIYHRKPSPNFLGIGREFDENAWQEHILKTLKAAKGCKLEITQRDVYTLGGNINKVRRAVEIVRELIEENW